MVHPAGSVHDNPPRTTAPWPSSRSESVAGGNPAAWPIKALELIEREVVSRLAAFISVLSGLPQAERNSVGNTEYLRNMEL